MTPEQIALVASSRGAADGAALSAEFYRILFRDNPELRSRFPDELGTQERKFIHSLDEIVRSISELDVFETRVRLLGADHHHRFGVRPHEYAQVREALLGALACTLGAALTMTAADAWRAAFDLIAETMMDGAAAAHRAR